MAIKWLMDFRKGLLTSPNEELNMKIEVIAQGVVDLAEQVVSLQNSVQEPQTNKKRIHSVSGRVIAEKE